MPLRSYLFQGNTRLEQCLVSHPAHVKPGDVGPHVRDIQIALEFIDGLVISEAEQIAQRYGPSTAAAVLSYKKKRRIINTGYQTSEDNVVGKMTMAALDKDMLDRQKAPEPGRRSPCNYRPHPIFPLGDRMPSAGALAIAVERALRQHAISWSKPPSPAMASSGSTITGPRSGRGFT